MNKYVNLVTIASVIVGVIGVGLLFKLGDDLPVISDAKKGFN
ncbi:MAG: hypothetical protein BWY78_01296 [Alphaproteobacteria bacterium ADurb.Bin438]|nr:MAG: hypothetical protein BWY78_01296 [Alphaproteobacteria bacterium ADurb.Bin438]